MYKYKCLSRGGSLRQYGLSLLVAQLTAESCYTLQRAALSLPPVKIAPSHGVI